MSHPPVPPKGHGLLVGKTVLVTAAAGTGIGFAVARRCVEEGGSDGIGSNVAFIVHGTDDRRVMNNLSYPHRTHIVFDNTGTLTRGRPALRVESR